MNNVVNFSEIIDQFRRAIATRGLYTSEIIADGKIHRCNTEGKQGKRNGAYILHLDGLPAGGFQNHADGLGWEAWHAEGSNTMTTTQLAEARRLINEARQKRETEETRRRVVARENAGLIWADSWPVVNHTYLTRKGVQAHGIRIANDGRLVVPMRDAASVLHSVQYIDQYGGKRFLTNGRKQGCYFSMGGKPDEVLLVCEGYATGASLFEATGYPVAVAFDAGNLLPVVQALRKKFPGIQLVICADDDYQTSNPGLTRATEAAKAVGGMVAVPVFSDPRPNGATDFNDLHQAQGEEVVRQQLQATIDTHVACTFDTHAACTIDTHVACQNAPESIDSGDPYQWPKPQDLTAKIEPEPYPLDALPDTIRLAVEEVQGFVKAPVPLVASSALAALSLTIQAHADAKRAEKLHGPVGLFLLTIANSGERKSTCDGFFTSAIRRYQEEQGEAAKPALKDHRAEMDGWEAKRGGIKDKIRQLSRASKSTVAMESALRDLEHDKPEPPRIPRLLYADVTPEALAYGLAKHWPSGGVVSAEAGIVFGSHGMNKDSAMRNLSLLNQLWDGASLTVDRRSTESFTVRGARLTVALQVQEPTLREFFTRSGALARGTGFLARFLVAWPESTQGHRLFTEAPPNWPHLAAFHQRIAAILNQPAPIDEDGALTPAMLSLSPDAKAAWKSYHDAVEEELACGGEFYEIQDVASKSADNAARLAALFQMFEGAGGAISLAAFESASLITAWHLHESRRFFGELALPAELADAARLDKWLIEHFKRERTHFISSRDAQRLGPTRDKQKLEAALQVLEELGRVRVSQDGRRKTIKVNPALVGVAP